MEDEDSDVLYEWDVVKIGQSKKLKVSYASCFVRWGVIAVILVVLVVVTAAVAVVAAVAAAAAAGRVEGRGRTGMQ